MRLVTGHGVHHIPIPRDDSASTGPDPLKDHARLALVEASRVALAKALDLIGIAAPRQM